MNRLLVTIDEAQPLQSIRKVKKQQQAYVKESLARAFNEVKEAELKGRKLQNVDDFIKELNNELI